jgi:hypothetical protein
VRVVLGWEELGRAFLTSGAWYRRIVTLSQTCGILCTDQISNAV